MRGMIEEFYYGNIEPQGLNNGKTTLKLKKKLSKVAEREHVLSKKLSDEEKAIFSELMENYNELSSLGCADSFISGFKLCARFMIDVYESK